MCIIAIDPGIKTGWARNDGINGVDDFSTRSRESKGLRYLRFQKWLSEVCQGCDVVVYEKPIHRHYAAMRSHSNFEGVLIAFCEDQGIQYKDYSPGEIKKHATGKGNANKAKMIETARERFGNIIDDNHADALWLGWSRPGYSLVIHLDGKVTVLRDFDADGEIEWEEVTWGAQGMNRQSFHIAYIGGVDWNGKAKDTRTKEQKRSLEIIVKYLLLISPNLKVIGHNQVAAKACPSFNVEEWLRGINMGSYSYAFAKSQALDYSDLFDLKLREDEI